MSRQSGSRSRNWYLILGSLSVCVALVIIVLIYLVFTIPAAVPEDATAQPVLSLPTAPIPTATPGPPAPQTIKFVPVEPVKGFSSCDSYGFKGVVTARNGERLQGVQIVAWEDKVGLLGLSQTDPGGSYFIEEVLTEPGLHEVWVQVFENDLPVSEAIHAVTQINCQTGFQIYQVDWQEVEARLVTPSP